MYKVIFQKKKMKSVKICNQKEMEKYLFDFNDDDTFDTLIIKKIKGEK